jgi:hypothetical protein
MSLPSQLNVGALDLYAAASKDGAVLLDIEHDRLLKLNRTGAEIWEMLKARETEAQIALKIAERYGIDQKKVAEDVRRLVAKISELGIGPVRSTLVGQPISTDKGKAQLSYPWYGLRGDETPPQPKRATVFFALLGLAAFDLVLWVLSLKALCSLVKNWPFRPANSPDSLVIGKVCSAVEKACVWYPRRALCLQRSAITTCLLRSMGIRARLTIGARPMPLLAHAWVEVDGAVVNDWPRVTTFYRSLVSY